MSNPRKEALVEAIKNKIIGILKAEEIFSGKGTILNMSNREIERVSREVASKVYTWIRKIQGSGKKLTGAMINRRVQMELKRI